MSNRSSSKQHCLVGKKFPKANQRDRKNKAKAAERRAERREEQKKRIEAARAAL